MQCFFWDYITRSCEFRCHRAGSQLAKNGLVKTPIELAFSLSSNCHEGVILLVSGFERWRERVRGHLFRKSPILPLVASALHSLCLGDVRWELNSCSPACLQQWSHLSLHSDRRLESCHGSGGHLSLNCIHVVFLQRKGKTYLEAIF